MTLIPESDRRRRTKSAADVVLAIHGGAGVITRSNMSVQGERRVRAALSQAIQAGYSLLAEGGSSLDAVVAAVKVLEDCPLFNAGKGAVFSRDGKIYLDASVMDGATGQAGAVSGARTIRNPVLGARAVMEHTPHVLLAGAGADRFARKHGLTTVDPSYFWTRRRWQAFQQFLEDEREKRKAELQKPANRFGTVGAVALDRNANLAAATSTGGMTGKMTGRASDSAIVGAGTYASNETCAVSCTGHGEFFIRGAIAHEVSALMKYGRLSLSEAAHFAIHRTLAGTGGDGGLIALDSKGNCALPFNSEGMFRAFVTRRGKVHVAIYR